MLDSAGEGALKSKKHFPLLVQGFKILVKFFLDFSGPLVMEQTIFTAMTRTLLRLRQFFAKNPISTFYASCPQLFESTGEKSEHEINTDKQVNTDSNEKKKDSAENKMTLKPKPKSKKLPDRAQIESMIKQVFQYNELPLNGLSKNLKTLIENTKEGAMLESYVQTSLEFLAVYGSPILYKTTPEADLTHIVLKVSQSKTHIAGVSQLFMVAEFLSQNLNRRRGPIGFQSPIVHELVSKNSSKSHSLADNTFMLVNVPQLDKEVLDKVISQSLESTGARVLLPELDIYIPTDHEEKTIGYALFVIDGWTGADRDVIQTEEDEEEVVEEIPPELRKWQCEVCTLLNPDNQDICLVCESPKPPEPRYPAEEAMLAEQALLKETSPDADLEDECQDEDYQTEIKCQILLQEDEEPAEVILKKRNVPDLIWSQSSTVFGKENRVEALKRVIIENLERVSADKRAEIKSGSEVLASEEFAEFSLCRITSEPFSDAQESLCVKIFESRPELAKNVFPGIESAEELSGKFFEVPPQELWARLSLLGVDFWMEISGPGFLPNARLECLPGRELTRFKEFIEEDICPDTERILELGAGDIRLEHKCQLTNIDLFAEDLKTISRYRETHIFKNKLTRLNNHPGYRFKNSLALLQIFNRLVFEHFKKVSIFKEHSGHGARSLGHLLSSLRGFLYLRVKNTIIEEVLACTAMNRDETPKIVIERLTKEKEITDVRTAARRGPEGQGIFLQSYNQLKNIPTTNLRPVKPKGAEPFICFEVILKNEHVMGLAGPYRQFFADVSAELQSRDKSKRTLELLVESPNRIAQSSDHKDKFCIRPGANSAFYLQLFEYLGRLMGMAYLTGTFVLLDLPTLFWKRILDLPVGEADLKEVDEGAVKYLEFIRETGEEGFDEILDRNFTCKLSDGSEVELVPHGANRKVTFQNRIEFARLMLETRLQEAELQTLTIRKGFTSIVPEVLLRLVSPKDLEIRVCGKNQIDFELLKRHTTYKNPIVEDSPLIKNFWEVLKEFSETDQLKFVKFCWGQERLPSSDHAYKVNQTRFMIKPITCKGGQDGMLPRSDTCFFNFELPNYSSKEIMRERIQLAINTDCDSMNADTNADNFAEGNMGHLGDRLNQSHSWVDYSDQSMVEPDSDMFETSEEYMDEEDF